MLLTNVLRGLCLAGCFVLLAFAWVSITTEPPVVCPVTVVTTTTLAPQIGDALALPRSQAA